MKFLLIKEIYKAVKPLKCVSDLVDFTYLPVKEVKKSGTLSFSIPINQ